MARGLSLTRELTAALAGVTSVAHFALHHPDDVETCRQAGCRDAWQLINKAGRRLNLTTAKETPRV